MSMWYLTFISEKTKYNNYLLFLLRGKYSMSLGMFGFTIIWPKNFRKENAYLQLYNILTWEEMNKINESNIWHFRMWLM